MITIGIDLHSRVRVAASVDAQGRARDQVELPAGEIETLLAWISAQQAPLQVAVEGRTTTAGR